MCGAATVMVRATDPDDGAPSIAGCRRERCAPVPARRGPVRPRRGAGPARHHPLPLRRARPRRGGRARRLPRRTRWSALLTAGPLTAAVVGFSPGFAYLDGPAEPAGPGAPAARPRPVVPAGSVAIANGHAAVYPTASPGGWHLVGRTGFPLFSRGRALPTPCWRRGTGSSFTVAGAGDAGRARTGGGRRRGPCRPAPARSSRSWRRGCAPSCRTAGGGPSPRSVSPRAGPADPGVVRRWPTGWPATRRGAGTLELTGGGTRLRCLGACHVAVVGAAPEVRVDGSAGAGRAAAAAWRAGQVLEVGRQHGGCRSYLAVAGGVPRARVVREQRQRRADRARRRPAARRAPCCMPERGRRRSGTISWRAGATDVDARVAGGAARPARPARRAVRGRRAGAARRGGLRGAAGSPTGSGSACGPTPGAPALRSGPAGEGSTPRAS